MTGYQLFKFVLFFGSLPAAFAALTVLYAEPVLDNVPLAFGFCAIVAILYPEFRLEREKPRGD